MPPTGVINSGSSGEQYGRAPISMVSGLGDKPQLSAGVGGGLGAGGHVVAAAAEGLEAVEDSEEHEDGPGSKRVSRSIDSK